MENNHRIPQSDQENPCNGLTSKSISFSRPSRMDIAIAAARLFVILLTGLAYLFYENIKFSKHCPFIIAMMAVACPMIALGISIYMLHGNTAESRKRVILFEKIGFLVLIILYLLHIYTYSIKIEEISGELVSSVCMLLFVWLLYAVMPGIVRTVSGRCSYPLGIRLNERSRFWQVVLIALGIRITITLLGMLIYKLTMAPNSTFTPFSLWQTAWSKGNTDVNHYLKISENWYVASGNDRLLIVFFPMFPILIHAFNLIFNNSFLSAQLINTVLSCFSAGMLYKLLRTCLSERKSFLASLIFLLLPGSVFMNSPMTEPLFMLLSCCCLYFAQKKNYLLAGLFAAFAGFTRSVGILLAVPIAIEGIQETVHRIKLKKRVAGNIFSLLGGLLLSTFGTLAYLGINKTVTGNAFMFSEYQKLNWNQSIGFFFDTPRYMTNQISSYIQSSSWSVLFTLALPTIMVIFGSLFIYIRRANRLPASYNAYFIAYFIIAMGCTWLLSAVRYMAVAVPLIAAIALLPKSKKGEIALIGLTTITHIAYLVFYMCRMSVY